MNLALFDFDGTLTTDDTFTQFIFFATPRPRLLMGYVLLAPWIFSYKLGFISASRMRRMIVGIAFWRMSQNHLEARATIFAEQILPNLIRPKVMDLLKNHQLQGDRVVIVSASLSVYLKYWSKQHNVELICSELCVRHSKFTGTYLDGDCSGVQKVKAITARIDTEKYDVVYAYGDTDEDLPMLNLADIAFYQGKPFARN